MSSINQKSDFTVIFTLNKKLRLSWISWPIKNIKTKPPRELLCEGPHTKHPVRYFPDQNEMNRGKKWDPSQGWMRANLLISRASFHFPVPPAPLRRHKSILYLFWAVSLPNPSDESTWGNSEWGWVHMTTVNWNGLSIRSAWIRLGWLTDTAWTSRSRIRHMHLDFTTWTDVLKLFCGQVSGRWFCQRKYMTLGHF